MALLIPIRPKNYRRISIYIIENVESPNVFLDGKKITDFSERGLLTQKGIRSCTDFEIRNGLEKVVGFHDHPDEMWISEPYRDLAVYCKEKGWLKIEGSAS